MTLISIIDDDPSVLNAMNSVVRSIGYSAKCFSSANAFLQSDYVGKTDCVISDIQMPEMNGVELFHHLRRQGIPVPFIFMTAFTDNPLLTKIGEETVVLHKPFDINQLVQSIEGAMAQAR